MSALYIIYMASFFDAFKYWSHKRRGINRTYLRLKFKGMQINQLLFLRGVCAFIWINVGYMYVCEWNEGIFLFRYFPFFFRLCFCCCESLRTRYSYVIKIHRNTLPFFESYPHWIIQYMQQQQLHQQNCVGLESWKETLRIREVKNNGISLQWDQNFVYWMMFGYWSC